ncbi:MAG: outer membrane protein assembly factor BamA, partial [Candidatus Marinimicrobia bacterium]|nr:outer membrane protein assembly factor BamA [Candidatus Neomarinimicrobiota bacterium]
MKKIFSLIFILSIGFAQGTQDDIKLVSVSVEGNEVTSTNTIIFTAGLREGQMVSPTEFPRAIKRLWKLGLFQDIQLRYDEESGDGLSLAIVVKENFILGDLTYEGNKKLKDRKFDDEISLSKGQRLRPNTLHETSKTIKQLYREKGYLNAEVEPVLNIPEEESTLFDGRAKNLVRNVVFNIQENDKIKIGDILIEGNKSFSDLRLRWKMKETKQQRWYMFWRSTFDEKKFDEDLNLISAYYRNNGYRDFRIVSDSVQLSENKKQLDLVVTVDEGPQYKYRNFSWEGMTLFEEEHLQHALGLETGDQFSDESFNAALFDRVQGLYMDRGYIYSRIDPAITPAGEDSLDIHFVVTENHKVYINHIAIKGNTRTRENVIRRQLRVFPGDVFNRERLMRSHREVMMLNYFANVVPDVVPVAEDKVDLEITVEEKPAGQANANMGYTQSFGMTGGGGLALPNFRGRGQSLNLSFNVGTNVGNNYYNTGQSRPKYRSASISFTDPMVNDTKNLVGGSIFYTFRGGSSMYSSPIDYTMAGGSVTWGRIFKWPDDFFRGTWSFQVVRKVYEGSQGDLDQFAGGLQQSDGVTFSQTIRRDSRDHPEFTTRGSSFSLKSTLSGGILGGQENFHKHILNLEWYTPTFWKFVLLNSMKIGVVKELPAKDGDNSFIPWNDRFIMGGNGIPYGNPLRGYDDSRVGPLTQSG